MNETKSSTDSSKNSLLPHFSHLYVERELMSGHYLSTTEQVIHKFPKSQLITVDNFSQIAQKRSGNWSDQKRSPKLVIARKKSDLLYPCSDVAPNFGHPNFYYAVPMQNCLYDCEYCYLQGMYSSAHLVYFVNQNEMIQAAIKLQKQLGELYICIAYDNDILALEKLLGVASCWIEGLRSYPDITIEIRTKSANFHALSHLPPASNFILAWTLSPKTVVQRFEAKTPSLKARLSAMSQALKKGWRVRLCLDPLIPIRDWDKAYSSLFEELDKLELWSQFEDASFGLFRMPKPFLRQAKKARPDSALLQNAQSREERGLFTLSGTNQDQLLKYVGRELRLRMDNSRVWQT